MKQRLGVWVEDVALALLRLSDRLRGTDHTPALTETERVLAGYEVPPIDYITREVGKNLANALKADLERHKATMGMEGR